MTDGPAWAGPAAHAGAATRPLATALAMPHRVEFGADLAGLLFPLMKLLPALDLVAAVPPGRGIIETSSGTMALALAMACASEARPAWLVVPPLEPSLERHIRALGRPTLVTVPDSDVPGGNQAARLRVLRAILRDRPSLVWTQQYENPLVPGAYEVVGRLLAETRTDCVVAPVGSGGSALGLVRGLRRSRPNARLVAVDAANSVLFGRADGPRRFPGMGNSIVPPLLEGERAAFDEVHWLSDQLVTEVTRQASRQIGILLGPSGAAALHVARWWAGRHKGMRVACVLPEMGQRYLGTLYSGRDEVAAFGSGDTPGEPVVVTAPTTGDCTWQAMRLRPGA